MNRLNLFVFLLTVFLFQSCLSESSSDTSTEALIDTLAVHHVERQIDSEAKEHISRNGEFSIIDSSEIKFYSHFNFMQTSRLDTCNNIKKYVGLIKDNNRNRYFLKNFRAERNVVSAETGAEFIQFVTDLTVKPEYVFESMEVDTAHWIVGYGREESIFAVGDFIEFNLKGNNFFLYCTGEIEPPSDNFIYPIRRLKNYEIHVRSKMNNVLTDTVIYSHHDVRPDLGEYVNGLGVSWIGDLNGDGNIDFIARRRNHYTHIGNSLYMTSGDSNLVVQKLAEIDMSMD